MDPEEYRNRAESFICELTEEFYMNHAGLKDSLNVSEIYMNYQDLFEKEVVLQLLQPIRSLRHSIIMGKSAGQDHGTDNHIDSDSSDTARRRLYLAAFAADGFMDRAVGELTDKIVSSEAQATVEFEGRKIPFRMIPVILANEPNARAREGLEAGRQEVLKKLNPLREERIQCLHSMAGELGYGNYQSLYADTKGLDLDVLSDKMEEFLDETDSVYTRNLEKAASAYLNMPLADVSRHDISYLFRGIEFDSMFPAAKLVTSLEATVCAMGLGHDSYPNIHIDTEVREGKTPRAFCAPLHVPDNIMLVVMPRGGYDDYHTILHEAGHAWHYGSVLPEQEFEYKYLGDNSVTESYAFLFQYLAMNENWVSEYTQGSRLEEYIRFSTLKKLYMLRRYAAKLLYELQLHSGGDLSRMPREYASILSYALKIRHPEVYYLDDLDDCFYAAQYLKAWIFEAQLRNFLIQRFGERAYAYPETGEVLKELFSRGQEYSVEELAERLGLAALDLDPLYEEIDNNLRA
ncbi:MAG: hypothetical protein GX872_06505 [Firmicutes bacterium]|nr:hypothetical protein [Bacillota bacterium]